MAGNAVTLTFAGDASKLTKAAAQARAATDDVAAATAQAGDTMGRAAAGSRDLATRMGSLGAATDGASTAIGDAAGTMQALADIQQFSERKAIELSRALADVEQANLDARQAVRDLAQAQLDQNQAFLDARQAGIDVEQAAIDVEQANLDAATAQRDYNAAVKEHGPNSAEARQAAIDLKQAQADLKQANLDSQQATADAAQAQEDGKQATEDAAQAARDAADAQINLRDAQMNANPPDLQRWADQMNLISPLLSGLIGVVALVTAAQWAWNAAQLASPTTWIVLAIVALIAVIVLIAVKTTWFQDLWRAAWGGIKSAAAATWDFIKQIPGWVGSAFSKIGDAISKPFKAGFNMAANAWNSTIGKLSWTVPSWVPAIGGNTISVPQIPTFHTGGVVPGAPGQEVLALLQAGETVTPAGQSAASGGGRSLGPEDLRMPSGAGLDAMFLSWLSALLRKNSLRIVAA